jgi:hypothetical protein
VQRGKGSKPGSRKRFRRSTGPSVPQSRSYEPTRSAHKPFGYVEIESASQLADDSEEWLAFVREFVNLPEQLAPAVREAIRRHTWKIAPNPLAAIRRAAHQEARRMGLEHSPGGQKRE